ncbi:MAG: DEAD/DEAH box helicase [Candidatus Binataceae bacterium]|nr:DEAD/DEAH box helicase [Candidatus Binataceae bacterium]
MEALRAEIDRLRDENARLLALLDGRGTRHRETAPGYRVVTAESGSLEPPEQPSALSTAEKVALFRKLFRGRSDVFPVRWESNKGRSGYAPACANEWKPGVCEKPRIKCGECPNRAFVPLDERVIFNHLAGAATIGVYPLLPDDTCHFLAVDFDETDWREDTRAFARSCRELDIPVALEISRSGNGAHAWIFFAEAVPAREARRLGTALISHACAHSRQLKLSSYDRLFPSQDTLPKGGFGNLIALPLQKQARDRGASVFVDEELRPHADQWAFLAAIQPMPAQTLEAAALKATGGVHPLDVAYVSEDDECEPWKRPRSQSDSLAGLMPERLTVTIANQLYFEKAQLPQSLANRLIRLAAFQNPEFYRTQAMRFSVWDKPRVIGCAENYAKHIALPRGCWDAVLKLLRENGIALETRDEREQGKPLTVSFAGELRGDQETAVCAMLRHEIGVLCAPTAFGKTVTAAAIIARRRVNTLILVHRTELLAQWQERLQAFLDHGKDLIGAIGGGKHKPTGRIDIAVMQSLSRKGEISDLVERYGQIVVDECHHLSAFSFEAILKRAKARYVLGLTATPVRRDGQHPIIFMQCGPIRHTPANPEGAPAVLRVIPRFLATPLDLPPEAGIQDVFQRLSSDTRRTETIAADIRQGYREGRKILVLTERTDHLEVVENVLRGTIDSLFVLHGRLSKLQRMKVIQDLRALPPEKPRVLLATGRLIGEGFDHPPLDTLALAMPISWTGTLQQYAGRLHRTHIGKSDVRIYDYVDSGHPALTRMWQKRRRGYRAMGYVIANTGAPVGAQGMLESRRQFD